MDSKWTDYWLTEKYFYNAYTYYDKKVHNSSHDEAATLVQIELETLISGLI